MWRNSDAASPSSLVRARDILQRSSLPVSKRVWKGPSGTSVRAATIERSPFGASGPELCWQDW